MSSQLHPAAQCYMATWNGEPVAFIAMIANFGHKGFWRISRVVTLPDYQGLGLDTRLAETVGDIYREQGKRVTILASHPAILRHREKSPLWRLTGVFKNGKAGHTEKDRGQKRVASAGRSVVSFE
ncbi:MAG: GNAT family N-acetyltransferase [Bacillota bacterium]